MVGLDAAFWPAAFLDAVAASDDIVLAGVCDLGVPAEVIRRDFLVDPDAWLAAHGLARTSDLDEVLAGGVDVALLATRPSRMPAVAETLVGAGVHVYAAKPLGVTGADARRHRPAPGSGVVVTAGQTASQWAPWPAVRDAVGRGRIGRVLTMTAFHQHGHYGDFPPSLWYADPAEGDLTTWLGWYPVEAVVSIMDAEVAVVTGTTRRLDSAHGEMPDTAHAVLHLADGRTAAVHAQFTVRGGWGMGMHAGTVFGDRGVVSADAAGGGVRLLTDGGATVLPTGDSAGLAGELGMLVEAIRGRGRPALEIGRAVHVAEVCAAWRESAGREGELVEVGAC